MYFNFGPDFSTGNQRPQRPRNRQQQQQGGGLFGGLNDFLHNGFMNPLFQRN